MIVQCLKTMEKIGRYEFLAEPFHCDFSRRLTMGHFGNHLLNAADFHSNDRNFGMNYLNPRHLTWVLSRLAIEIEEMPKAYDRFTVETWVESAMRFFTNRNFAVVGVQKQPASLISQPSSPNKVYGFGRSVWAMIDTETRQPVDILGMRDGEMLHWVEPEKECPIAKSSRVKMTDQAELVRTIDTHYSDVDMNGHVNSIRYIEHVVDLWPIEWYREHSIRRFEVAYVAEAHAGDQLSFYREQQGGDYFVRICKDGGDEVVRCKITFIQREILEK